MHYKKYFFVTISLFLFSSVFAQPFYMQTKPSNDTQIYLKYFHPSYKTILEMTSISGSYELTFNSPFAEQWNFFLTVPYAHYEVEKVWVEGVEIQDFEYNESGFGNIFIGAQWRKRHNETNQSSATIGFGLPTIEEKIAYFGLLNRLYSNVLYAYDNFPIYTNYAFNYKNENGLVLGMEFGPDIWIYTGDDPNGETEVFLHYALMAGFEGNKIAGYAEFLGSMALTEDNYVSDTDEGFAHALNFGASWMDGIFRPGLYYQIYLTENMSDIMDGVFGISLGFVIDPPY